MRRAPARRQSAASFARRCASLLLGLGAAAAAAAGNASQAELVVAGWDPELVKSLSTFHCTVSRSFTDSELVQLRYHNCLKVQRAFADFRREQAVASPAVAAAWERKTRAAAFLCAQANATADPFVSAWLAVNAWGNGIMGGAECCNLVRAPHCLAMERSLSTLALGAFFGVVVVMLLGTAATSCLARGPQPRRRDAADEDARSIIAEEELSETEASSLYTELQQRWLQSHCLRVLPAAQDFANLSADVFASLQVMFDFQADSVRNQHEHLLSLWRSHCATVADRAVQRGRAVDEAGLLAEALGDLHAELLEGFWLWREGLRKSKAVQIERATSQRDLEQGSARLRKQLGEVAVYLLVWGEAGNVRFMPEVLYFIVELILASDGCTPRELYGAAAVASYERSGPFHSGLFLAKIIRPIYNAICDEWYDCVTVNPQGQDVKQLREGFDTYLPPDVSNYDDWNELFCSPERMAEGLRLTDGTLLFDQPHAKRFAVLHDLDWAASLDPQEVKTHREVHSLWGVFATTHRIWLLHAVLFLCGVSFVSGSYSPPQDGTILLQGNTTAVRFAAIGLLVPLHGLLWAFARYQTSTPARRHMGRNLRSCLTAAGCCILYAVPVLTYAVVRYLEVVAVKSLPSALPAWLTLEPALVAHADLALLGFLVQLLFAGRRSDRLWQLTKVPARQRAFRYLFWIVLLAIKCTMSLTIFNAVAEETATMDLVRLGREPLNELSHVWYSTSWGASVMQYFLLWGFSLFLFVADTGVWYQAGCTCLGVIFIISRRKQFALERSVYKIPERFSRKVFRFSAGAGGGKGGGVSAYFPMMWDRIMEQMRVEDKCDNESWKVQSFNIRAKDAVGLAGGSCTRPASALSSGGVGAGGDGWRRPRDDLLAAMDASATPSASEVSHTDWAQQASESRLSSDGGDNESESSGGSVQVPEMFVKGTNIVNIGLAMARGCKTNAEMRWRLNSVARCLAMPMPRPFRAPYIPGITVLIPHLREDIVAAKEDLYSGDEVGVPLMDFVQARYADEFKSFIARMQTGDNWQDVPEKINDWSAYSESQWEAIAMWASMRLQTLWRTVAGISLYHAVLQSHYEAQADDQSALAAPSIWDPSDCFTCLVSMQMYRSFTEAQLRQTNRMFAKFPDSLKVAYIDWSEKNVSAEADSVHPRQRRRYFSCLVDRGCPFVTPSASSTPSGVAPAAAAGDSTAGLRRVPKFRIELPGYPILGDGKSDNQNHAIPFMRGAFCQCIDSNQGAYFEQMLLLPCVLGEFRTTERGGNEAKRIIGLPEHITSDFGSVGDFAAGSELAFGTVLQRSHAVLGARMHYGHPDIMNKQYMMQQGGVSKATKTLNLSEDIFAGMDFMLRGNGRKIRHCEYFYLTKGRDLGFNAVMGFFSKISSGTGEQILTRQMFRLGQILPLPESLSFYYAHAGYYLTQAFISLSMPFTVATWLLVLAAGCEDHFTSFMNCPEATAGEAMAKVLSAWCSWVLLFFLVAQALPLFMQMWMEMGLKSASTRIIKQWCTGSWCFFIFQAKLVGHYVLNEIRYGGARYVSTGRGLPTQRRPFLGIVDRTTGCMDKVGGLYLDFARLSYYDGVKLTLAAALVPCLGGFAGTFTWCFVALTAFSWLYAPFLFNPYQFSRRYFREDLQSWLAFFGREGGGRWADWYEETQLRPRRGFRHSVWDIKFLLGFFVLAVWCSAVSQKVELLRVIFDGEQDTMETRWSTTQFVTLAPPVAGAAILCLALSLLECALCMRPRSWASVTADGTVKGYGGGLPLLITGTLIFAAEVVESVAPLLDFYRYGWTKSFLSGVILKILLFSLVLFLAEAIVGRRYFRKLGACGRPLELFVLSNRFMRDAAVSAWLLCTLGLGTLLNTLNEVLLPSYNLHHLLIYRASPLRLDPKERPSTKLSL